VPFKDAAHNAGRAALVAAAFHAQDWELLGTACEDRLHEPYRAPLIPGFEEAREGSRAAGALAVFLSGAGPTLLAIGRATDGTLQDRLSTLCAAMRPAPWTLLSLAPDNAGAVVE
jgi:homoserine kinase